MNEIMKCTAIGFVAISTITGVVCGCIFLGVTYKIAGKVMRWLLAVTVTGAASWVWGNLLCSIWFKK